MMAEVRALRKEVESSEAQKWQIIQMLSAYDRLEEQIIAGEPYRRSLYGFRLAAQTLPDHKLLTAPLIDHQKKGIATKASLQSEFEQAYQSWQNADGDNAGGDVLQSIKRNVSQLVTVRKTGADHQGVDAGSVLARLEHAIGQADLTAALAECSSLPTEVQPYFGELCNRIRARQNVMSQLSLLRSAVESFITSNPSYQNSIQAPLS